MTGHFLPESTNACPTSPTTDQPELLPVIQADREAAALVFDIRARRVAHPATITMERHHAKVIRAGEGDDYDAVQAAAMARTRLTSTTPTLGDMEATLREAAKPWADYHGDLPDYDHPLRPVYESGIQYAVELLAKELNVEEWVPCDGTEEFDGDLGGTLMNVVLEAMPKDEHGDPIYPRDLAVAPASPIPTSVNGAGERERIGAAINSFSAGMLHSEKIDAVLAALSPALDNTAVNRERIARALFLRRNPPEHVGNSDFAWQCAKQTAGDPTGEYYADADAILALSPALDNTAVEGLRSKIEAEARRYAGMYPQNSDGQNTFVMFADYVATLTAETEKAR